MSEGAGGIETLYREAAARVHYMRHRNAGECWKDDGQSVTKLMAFQNCVRAMEFIGKFWSSGFSDPSRWLLISLDSST